MFLYEGMDETGGEPGTPALNPTLPMLPVSAQTSLLLHSCIAALLMEKLKPCPIL